MFNPLPGRDFRQSVSYGRILPESGPCSSTWRGCRICRGRSPRSEGAGRWISCISHFPDHFSALYFLSDTRPELAQVAVKRLESVPVIDHQAVSISLFPGSKGNDSVAGCIDFRAHFGGKVHA